MDISFDMQQVQCVQRYSWLALYTIVLTVYLFESVIEAFLLDVAFMGSGMLARVLQAALIVAGGILVLHLVVCVYRIWQGDRREGSLSLGAAIGTAALFAGAMWVLEGMSGTGMQLTFAMTGVLNLLALFVAGVTAAMFRQQLGRYSTVFVVLYLGLFVVLFVPHYLGASAAAAVFADAPDIENPVLTGRTEMSVPAGGRTGTDGAADDAFTGQEFLRALSHVPPPTSGVMRGVAMDELTPGGSWTRVLIQPLDVNTPTPAEGAVCGGTYDNYVDRYGKPMTAPAQQALRNTLIWSTELAEVEADTDLYARYIQAHCADEAENGECPVDLDTTREDLDRLIAWERNVRDTLFALNDMPAPGTETIVRGSCTGLPETYYRLEITDITCGVPFQVTVENTGTRRALLELDGDVTELPGANQSPIIEAARGTFGGTVDLAPGEQATLSPAQFGRASPTFDQDTFHAVYLEPQDPDGQPIRWSRFPLTDYCMGGSHCENCTLQYREYDWPNESWADEWRDQVEEAGWLDGDRYDDAGELLPDGPELVIVPK